MVLTDGAGTGGRPLADVVAAAVEGGARAVVLREKHLPRTERAALADRLRPLLAAVGGLLIVASDPAIPADGLHLAAADPMPAPGPALLGRSCHDAAEVASAAAEDCAYATLSPIFTTASKPGYGPALGPAALGGHPLPVWALGGVTAGNAGACVRSGAAGVAVMGTVMRADDPAAAAAAVIAAAEEALAGQARASQRR
ncbi:thiamine phosphate synthase [Acidiferrimicrobium sp. IK]|uniref:thiamine phosphate synthase n=1 Tax=Acidiferrimicrobium sp. IK TaxID=2871700 RepID=UPI0021CB11E5|nr:thiamine phosphate synthase [Acidiferrimicrobium sp. IK]MCU4183513.1 thiamine phosphate synthase [Acidiferrimicrobium sp. IK]